MPQGLEKRIAELQARIEVFQNENAQLSERAEDSLLIRLIYESIGLEDKVDLILESILERISILKNIPYCACCELKDDLAKQICVYTVFSEKNFSATRVRLSPAILKELEHGTALITQDGLKRHGLDIDFSGTDFVPFAALIIFFSTRAIPRGLFLFMDDEADKNKLSTMSILLQNIINMVVAKLDKITLIDELKCLNNELDLRVKQRTRTLARANKKLHQLQHFLSGIIDSMPSVLIGVDLKARVTHWNKEAEQVTGILKQKAVGRPFDRISEKITINMPLVKSALDTGQKQTAHKRLRPEGNTQHFEDVTVYPLIEGGVQGAVIRIDNVTEKVIMEEMMVQSEKMMSVGGLAAGMAHEINNPLAGMIQSATVIKSRLKNTSMSANLKAAEEIGISIEDIRAFMEKRDIFRMIDTIHDSGSRAAEIISGMLDFARKSVDNISSHYPDQLMDKILNLAITDFDLKKQYDFKSIKIIKQYDDNLPIVFWEGAKIQQVLLNILRNGAQAMQEAQINDPQFILRIYNDKSAQMVCMEIEDNGPGMDEQTRSKIFDPFFTTKPVGVGTGLGLSISYFIITENHKGTIEVISQPDKGANFKICLPLKR